MKNKVPIFIVEEHNEVFPVWYNCIKKGILKVGSSLLHFDEHADMGIPRLNKSLDTLINTGREELSEYALNELGIATFIYPAIYLGFFNHIHWFKQGVADKADCEMFVTSYNGDGMKLIGGKCTPRLKHEKSHDPNFKFFQYVTTGEKSISQYDNSVLDIDLDYFSCTGNPNELMELRIETSAAEYHEMLNNPYHRIRYQNLKIHLEIEDGRYYLIFNRFKYLYPNSYPYTLKVGREIIELRITELIDQLMEKEISPQMITVCRSRFSGFTPEDQWRFIERELLGRLKNIYHLEYSL